MAKSFDYDRRKLVLREEMIASPLVLRCHLAAATLPSDRQVVLVYEP